MKKEELILISAYTGYILCPFGEVKKLYSEIIGRSLNTHEMTNPDIEKKVEEVLKPKIIEMCKNTFGDEI